MTKYLFIIGSDGSHEPLEAAKIPLVVHSLLQCVKEVAYL